MLYKVIHSNYTPYVEINQVFSFHLKENSDFRLEIRDFFKKVSAFLLKVLDKSENIVYNI